MMGKGFGCAVSDFLKETAVVHNGEVLTLPKELHVLLYNGNPKSAQLAADWRKLPI
jgi:hypothetical protein